MMNRLVALILGMAFLPACQSQKEDIILTDWSSSAEMRRLVAAADECAQQGLEDFNASAISEKFAGPYRLEEYSKKVMDVSTAPHPHLFILYELNEQHPNITVVGHPAHFSVTVDKATGRTHFSEGM